MVALKIIMKVILAIVTVLILLDFIPVKIAVKEKNIAVNETKTLEINSYQTFICRAETKLSDDLTIRWIAKKEDNLELSDDILLKLTENNPHNILSLKDFDVKLYQNMTYNKFLVSGKCINIYESNYTVVELSGSRWDILTPIKRLSFRRFYAPKSYLTIYDFDWSKFFGKEKTNP